MDKKEFIVALEELGWPKEEYVILSGGSLLLTLSTVINVKVWKVFWS